MMIFNKFDLLNIRIELVCVPSDKGHGANDSSYYPVGLLTIASHIKKHLPEVDIEVIDLHNINDYEPNANIVGISSSSALNYGNVLKIAAQAKKNGTLVVIGGPHASNITNQILQNRHDIIDFIVKGKGEDAFLELVKQYMTKQDYYTVPNLYWYDKAKDAIIHSERAIDNWNYDNYLPLNFDLLKPSLDTYWNNFRKKINASYDAVFIIFTHFGCKYKQIQSRKQNIDKKVLSKFCSYCALENEVMLREPENIVNEVLELIGRFQIHAGAKIHLKCYGDNIGPNYSLLDRLSKHISSCEEWEKFNISWTFYMQSNYMSDKMAIKLKEIDTENLFIGFDSADERVQKVNGLGTNNYTHKRCIDNCKKYGINIQAALMLGCAGENKTSLYNNLNFAKYLATLTILERINTSICVVMPGAENYELLKSKEQWIENLDYLDTIEMQKLWIKHFCPEIWQTPNGGLDILYQYINEIDRLSPRVHSSMGYLSDIAKESN